MTAQQTAEGFLLGGGGKSASFPSIGTSITGTIATPPEVRQQTDFDTGRPATWDDGNPKMQLVVQLQTTDRVDENDDGIRNLYVKGSKDPASQSLHAAVAEAVVAAGANGLQVGGTLTVAYIGDGEARGKGWNPPKRYAAKYVPPTGAEFLGTEQGTVEVTTGEIVEPPKPAGPTREQVAAIRAAGLDPAAVFPGFTE